MIGTRKWLNNYGIPKKTSNKRHGKYVVFTKAHGFYIKGIMIKGKVDGKSKGISSLINPKKAQVNDAVSKASNKIDDSVFINDNYEFHDMFTPINNDEFVSEEVNDNEVINDGFVDEIFTVKKFPRKGKKISPSSAKHDVKEIVTHILHEILENVKINEHDVNGDVIFKMSIEEKKVSKNSPYVPFNYEEIQIKWNFVYNRRINLDNEFYVETLKYSEIMKPFSDAQSLTRVLNNGSWYPKLVKEFVVKLPIGFLYLICGVNNDVSDEDRPNMESVFGPIKNHILNALIYKANAMQEIIDISTTRKGVCEGLAKMISLQSNAIYCYIIYFLYQKDIVICDYEIGSTPSFLTLSYMMIAEKDVIGIVINIITPVDETDMVFEGEMLYGPMTSHILKGFDS
ncbi:hypothetical protein KIW84_033538 [Lathyrus oleraceus]|uniref:Uncharacterized protein n=1 Tax=Pisum sativum TaxID=3888 RepID=A0A9D4XWV7_PEA|nr:hypothetical protein KIW84_033538 [Pisum sativum]